VLACVLVGELFVSRSATAADPAPAASTSELAKKTDGAGPQLELRGQWNLPAASCSCDWSRLAAERDSRKPSASNGSWAAGLISGVSAAVILGFGLAYVKLGKSWARDGAVAGVVGSVFGLSWYGVEAAGDNTEERERQLAEFDFCFSRCQPRVPTPAKDK
jgi:hypothetical protein